MRQSTRHGVSGYHQDRATIQDDENRTGKGWCFYARCKGVWVFEAIIGFVFLVVTCFCGTVL